MFLLGNFKAHFHLFFLGVEPGHCKENTISTICVVVVVFVVALLLVAVITHKLTEHFVRKKLLESLSESSDSTPDPCSVDPFFCVNCFASVCTVCRK